MIDANARAGKAVQRVQVVLEPLTDYLRFELTWGYEPNVAAGEDVRIIPVGQGGSWPDDVPQHDCCPADPNAPDSRPACGSCGPRQADPTDHGRSGAVQRQR
ncbi:MAG: DUF6879 family protein [Pseudonocardiaceae bacterium]